MPKPIDFNKVADIYDYYVNIKIDIPFFLKETENISDEILELMCGTGRVSIPLLENGRKITCVDYSEGMLQAFSSKIKDKGFPVELINMDVANLVLKKKFKLIFIPFHSLSEILTPEKQQSAIKAVADHLTKDGIFICTLQNPKVRLKTADGQKRTLGKFQMDNERELIISYINQYNIEKNLVYGYQFYDIYNSDKKLIENRYLEINFSPITDDEFQRMIINAGLKIVNLYGDYSWSDFNEEESMFMIYKMIRSGRQSY